MAQDARMNLADSISPKTVLEGGDHERQDVREKCQETHTWAEHVSWATVDFLHDVSLQGEPVNENIRVLKSEFENISLEYDYLSSAEKLLEYQSLYFEERHLVLWKQL